MTQKQFKEVAQKYKRGECSEEEKKLLFDYCNKMQIKNSTEDWDLPKENQVRKKLLQRINQTIIEADKGTTIKRLKLRHRTWYVAVTIFVLVLGTSILYYRTSPKSESSSSPLVTLKLQDGRALELKESNEIKIYNSTGDFIAFQKNKELNYSGENTKNIHEINTLTVPYGFTFNLKLSDGTKVYLNAGSSVKFPVRFADHGERRIYINGEAYLEVAKDVHRPFIVKSGNMNVRVLGTKFNIKSYPEDTSSEVVLVEGSVCLYSKDKAFDLAHNTVLTPGQKASFRKSDMTFLIAPVQPQIYTSWVEGELIFRNRTFNDILQTIERAYNIKIINKNEQISNERFNANFGKDPTMKDVLEELKTAYKIDYQIEGDRIIIN